jgi:hypothetical protein
VNADSSVYITQDELEAEEWASKAWRDRLPGVRALAGQWTATVGVITGLLGAGTLLSADSTIQALASPWSLFYGLLAGGALLAVAISTLYGSLASQGTIKDRPISSKDAVELLDSEVARSVRQLHASRVVAGFALVLLIAALGVRWYAPQVQSSKPSWTVIKTGDNYTIKQR